MISDINIRVDRDRCYACGICVERCIMDNLRLSVAPCRSACPIHMNCQGYVRLIAQGKASQAAEEMRRHTPFGAILGRICSHPCEARCEREGIDGAVHIRALKRYLADSFSEIARMVPDIARETGRRAAVIGSGPAGLTAAYELRRKGHQVTVFEARSEPGGLLRHAIPSFRLPVQEVASAVRFIEEMGVRFRTGEGIGRNLELDELERQFGAVVLAAGAGSPLGLAIPGDDLPHVIQALDFLEQVKAGQPPAIGRSVVVIGGGNSAVDAALTSLRLGASDVRMVCLEDRLQMPAFSMELQEALEEGVSIENCWGPRKLIPMENGGVTVEFSGCVSLLDDSGRFDPKFEPTCGLSILADTVIVAIGQRFDASWLPPDLLDPATGGPAFEPLTGQSPVRKKVFVAGCGSGDSATVVHAMGQAAEVAESVDRFLIGEGLRWGRGFWSGPHVRDFVSDPRRAIGGPRGVLRRTPIAKRSIDREVELVLDADSASLEAERCLSCGRAFEANRTCWYCLPCEIECPVKALEVRMPYAIQ